MTALFDQDAHTPDRLELDGWEQLGFALGALTALAVFSATATLAAALAHRLVRR